MTIIGLLRFPLDECRFNFIDIHIWTADATIVVKVIQHGRFKVYIYDEEGGQHHLPHCHVYWSNRSASVALPSFEVIEGDALPKVARALLDEHRGKLEDTWDMLNPGRPVE